SPDFVFVPTSIVADRARSVVYVVWTRYQTARAFGGTLVPGGLFLDTRPLDGSGPRPLRALPPDVAGALDAALGPAGDLFIYDGLRIHHLTMPAGLVTGRFQVAPAGDGPGRVAVLADGRLALALPGEAVVRLYAPDGQAAGTWPLPRPGVAVAPADAGAAVLLQAAPGAQAAPPVILTLDPQGREVARLVPAAAGVPPPPQSNWPWSLEVASGAVVFTTADGFFTVRRLVPAGGTSIQGSVAKLAFAPQNLEPELLAAAGLTIAPAPDGGAVALDTREARVVAFDAEGIGKLRSGAPTDAVDAAADETGALFVTTRSGWVRSYPAGEGVRPAFEVPCDCDLGGRVAAVAGRLYVTRPRDHRVAVMDAASGRQLREMWASDTVGLWPADVAQGESPPLFTADLVGAQARAWSPDGDNVAAWRAGLLAGPRRLAFGRDEDGLPVVAALMADGFVELHRPDDGNLVARWRPRLADASTLSASDLAIDSFGRVLLADDSAGAVRVFARSSSAEPTPPPLEPTPIRPPSDAACVVRGTKAVFPGQVDLGGTARVTLTLAADCPARTRVLGADIVLVLDRSGSMYGSNLAAAKAATRSFAELADVRHHRLALASFSGTARIDVALTDNVAAVIDGLEGLEPEGETNITAAVEAADSHLQAMGREAALPVLVLLTDGRNNLGGRDPREVARAARSRGVQVYTIGLGADVDVALLQDLAGSPERYFSAPTPAQLFGVYGKILSLVVSSLAGNLVVDDRLGAGVRYRPASARPAALERPDRLRWGRSLLPATGITFTYDIITLQAGRSTTSREAVAEYTDADGVRRRFTFPDTTLDVIAPTPEATPGSARPSRVFLPLSFRSRCIPGVAHADVVLLVDTSSSMAGAKLEQAQAAAGAFVELLDLPRDQAAVIGFDRLARTAVPLTGDRSALTDGIRGLVAGKGTRIDGALEAAVIELTFGAARNPANRAAIVLLTDGAHSGDPADVLRAAEGAARAGATIYAVALGQDADVALLKALASPRRTFVATGPAALLAIYKAIAVRLPCR
ncbi:MAG: VWA domain-containing protein, partial [Anaerolineae bacterium]